MQDTSVVDTQIHKISSLAGYQQSLNHLLVDSVNNGASIGFIAPLRAHKQITTGTVLNAIY